MSSGRGGVGVPFLALKRVTGSDQPVFFSFPGENKAISPDELGITELTNTNCWATPQGWVLVRSAASSSTCLLDPHSNGYKIELPHLPTDSLSPYCSCLLCCFVLLVETDAPIIWYCRIVGDDDKAAWVRHEYDIGTLPLPDLGEGCSEKLVISPVTACQGKVYFNANLEEGLHVLDLCSPTPVFSFIAIRNAIPSPLGGQKVFMVESQQELFVVCLLPQDRIIVHRMDFSEQEWRPVDDIGDRVLLLSSWYFAAARPAEEECGLERNCVYMVCPWSRCLMVFNLRDGTARVQRLHKAPAADQALWILPTTQS
ncbi:hypothetical protein ACP4OV_007386 [Aristida adscensionis]